MTGTKGNTKNVWESHKRQILFGYKGFVISGLVQSIRFFRNVLEGNADAC